MEDAKTTDRWYIAVAMGRHAGHLALGISKSAGATLAIIPEEFGAQQHIPIKNVCDILEGAILKRRAMGNNHGVLVIAEGVGERLSAEELKKIPGVIVDYDNYGHLRLAEVELGKIIKLEVEKRFRERGDKVQLVEINIGYVLRCADPIPFDQEYTRELGYNAVRYLFSQDPAHRKNAMICVMNGRLKPLYFDEMIDPATGKTEVRLVDVSSDSYKIARNYMVRLEKNDFEDEAFLTRLSEQARMTTEEFVKNYHHLAE